MTWKKIRSNAIHVNKQEKQFHTDMFLDVNFQQDTQQGYPAEN